MENELIKTEKVHMANIIKDDIAELIKISPESVIEEIRTRYMPLVIIDENDKSGYEVVSTARKHVKKLRTSIEAKRKELNGDAVAYKKAIDGKAKELTEMITPIEEHLEKEEQRFTEAQERLKNLAIAQAKREEEQRVDGIRKAAEEKQKLSAARAKELVKIGCLYNTLNGIECFTLGTQSIEVSHVDEASEDAYAYLRELFTNEAIIINAEKAKAAEIKAAEEKELAAQKLANEKRLQELQASEEKLKAQIFKNRLAKLERVEWNGTEATFEKEEVIISASELEEMTDEEFDALALAHNKRMSTIDEERIAAMMRKRVTDRANELDTYNCLKMPDNDFCIGMLKVDKIVVENASNEEWQQTLSKVKAENERLAEKERKERALKIAPDITKLQNFQVDVKNSIKQFMEELSVDSENAKRIIKRFDINLNGLMITLTEDIKNLK